MCCGNRRRYRRNQGVTSVPIAINLLQTLARKYEERHPSRLPSPTLSQPRATTPLALPPANGQSAEKLIEAGVNPPSYDSIVTHPAPANKDVPSNNLDVTTRSLIAQHQSPAAAAAAAISSSYTPSVLPADDLSRAFSDMYISRSDRRQLKRSARSCRKAVGKGGCGSLGCGACSGGYYRCGGARYYAGCDGRGCCAKTCGSCC